MFISLSILCCLTPSQFLLSFPFRPSFQFSYKTEGDAWLSVSDFVQATARPPAPCRGSGVPTGTGQVVCVRDSLDWTTQYSLSSPWLLSWCLGSPDLVPRAWKIPVCSGILKMGQMNLTARMKVSRPEAKTFQLPPPSLGLPPGEVTHT